MRRNQGQAVNTVNRCLVTLRRLLGWLADEGHVSTNVAKPVKELRRQQLAPQGLEQLHKLTDLEYLYLSRTKVDDADLRHLKKLTNLRHLDVTGTAVSDAGVEEVKRHAPGVNVVW